MCCANGSFMWSDSLFLQCYFFLIKRKKFPEEGKKINKTKHWRVIQKNIWIQNLPEGVDRFFLNKKPDVKR